MGQIGLRDHRVILVLFSLVSIGALYHVFREGSTVSLSNPFSRSQSSPSNLDADAPPPSPKQQDPVAHITPPWPPSKPDDRANIVANYPRFDLQPAPGQQSPFAFVFYATNAGYLCSALLMVHQLSLQSPGIPTILMIPPDFPNAKPAPGESNPFDNANLTPFAQYNTTILRLTPPKLPEGSNPYYGSVLLKLMAFSLHHHIPHLTRVIVLDADQMILPNRSLHSLFLLPPQTVIAAPYGYWIAKQGITSTLMVITLSDRIWKEVEEGMQGIKVNEFDMDLINRLFFPRRITMLPGAYCTLNSHWEENDIPSWSGSFYDSDGKPLDSSRPEKNPLKAMRIKESDRTKWKEEVKKGLEVVWQEEAAVIHFTAGGKPWDIDMRHLKTKVDIKGSDKRFVTMFEDWRKEAKERCTPGWEQIRIG